MRCMLMMVGLGALGCGAHSGAESRPALKPRAACTPELYGAGLFTTGAWDFFMAFSPDQQRVLFGRADDSFERYTLLETRWIRDGHWSAPTRPRFATDWSNADPHVSPDGRTVYFISNQPQPGEPGPRASYDIWAASLGAGGEWGDAKRLPAPVNDPSRDEWSPAIAANGNLYFGGEREGTLGGSDLWVSRWVDGAYQPPENLGAAINSTAHELEPWIAPDERYLIFSALRRQDGLGGYDLFISRKVNGTWEPARRLCDGINTRASEYNHSVSPDGKWLYFSSTRTFTGDVGERFDVPRDDHSLTGIGSGTGDMYRIPMNELGL
ncbi:Xaa-Pro aminopeptidase [Myxococcus stipitatus]|uniref:Xaa-Pro aminopeptidase n=1 Tax=Myxococcus stipitatus TaxID=83455 RepID=UPI0030CDACE1